MNERILLVEDDDAVLETTTLLLERVGYVVVGVSDGAKALEVFRRERFDLVVLDLILPSLDGLEVCRTIRRTSLLPIVILSARDDQADVVAGLELGADDYVTKPFGGRELIARVRATLRRASIPEVAAVIHAGPLEIDTSAFRVTHAGRPVELTATEFRLLLELARNPDRVFTREELLKAVWGFDFLGDSRLVDMAVKRLRDKLDDDPRIPRYIGTMRGVGYRFERA